MVLTKIFCKLTFQATKLPYYYVEDADLIKYTTTKVDKKNGGSNHPSKFKIEPV